ncbi:hypothetical protein JKF63_07475 [Porcisia hertigi]|uniref:SAC3/GANP/THP3 conserved domain-containing protein n=1 Tax=Porcisia hertigi TaxID=2761500 RepID=A0A836IYZ6_9TRYP|nr:hypothetical protein JKF63_07475 [Porcisia hertigi]
MQGAKYSHQQQLQGHPSVTAEGSDVPYSDANVATVLSLSPFSEFCKLRDNWAVKPLIRGRYSGMCGGDPAQRERREDFEYITLTSSPSTSPQACGSVAGRQGAWGQVEAFSRSAAGKTIDPARQRTPLALEKSMHFLVEHYLRVPHTSLVYTEPFRIWGYLWDRFRSIRTTWGPQLPPSNVSLQGYVDSESNRSLSAEELHRESSRRVRWLEFTVAALAVGGAYLCCSPEGCQRFMQDKKQFLESMSQCFTDLTVFYRAEQRHRNAEFFSVLLLLYGLQQEMKVEDRSSFCCFRTVIVNGEPRLCPENTSESVNLAQVYRELEKQPYMLETRPVRIALELIHCWAARQWFRFFELCKSTCMTPLQRAVAFQSFTYCRYRAVLDLVLPNYYVYPKLRVRHTMPITELADQLIMHHDHCLEFLKRMGLGAQLELKTPQQQPHHAATLHHHDASVPPIPAVDAPPAAASSRSDKAGWHLNLCYPNSDPLITADELEKRCENKRILFFPTHPAFFGFRVSHEAYRRFPDAKGFPSTGTEHHCDAFVSAGERLSLGRGAVRSLSRGGAAATNRGNDGESGEDDFYADEYCNDSCNEELEQEEEEKEEEDGNRGSDDDVYEKAGEDCDSPPRRRSTASPLPSASLSFDRETALLCQLGCPVNLMEVLEVYCPPYNSDVAALRLSDAGEELFASLPEHRAEMLRRCRRVCLCARRWRGASRRDDCTAAAISDEKTLHWAERMEEESVSTASSFFDDTEDESVCDEENDNNDFDAAAVPHPSGADVPSSRDSVATLEIINESRKLLSSIRNNPLYAAAAADCATTEQKAQRATQEQADVRGAAASTTTTTTSAPQASSLEPLSPTPRSKEKQVLALTRAGDCTVVPLPDNYSDDTDQRRKSHDSRDVESPTATLQPQRQAHLSETHVGAQTMTVDSETAPQKMRAAQLGRPMSIDREDSAETVASHQYSPAGKSAAPPLSVAMSPSERFADIPKPIAPVTANMFTPGRRKQICVAETDNTATTPAAGQREGSSTSNSSGSSAPMLGYSHLKPLKPSLSDAVEGDRHSEPLSGRDGSPSASALDDSEARSDSSSAESGAAPPPCSSLWGGQRHLPLPPPAATIDSFTPRQTIEESRASSAAAAPASHHTSREVAREVAGVKESSEDGVVEVQASSSPSGPSKRHVTEAGLQRGAYVKRPSSTLPPASSTNVFARACVPLIEEYLHHWMRLTHEDDRTVHAAAQYIVDIHESEAAEAAATHSASTTTEEGDEAAPAANTRRWSRAQRCVSKALEAKERSAAAAATWWRQRRLQNTASAMARVARQLLTTAVLRGNMSEYGQLMWDLSLSEPDPSRSTGRVPTFGDRLRTTDAARREATKARAADGHYDDKDDARAARLSRGCSAAMLSAGDVEAILAAAPTRTSNTLAKRSHDVGTAWSSAENAGSVLSSVPCTYAEEDADLGHAMVTSKAALNEAIHTLLRSTDRAGRLPSHDSLTASLSSAVDVSLDAVNASDRSRSACAAAALQLTSLYVWVSTESDDHGAYAASSVTLTGTSTPNATAFARLFQNERERWLVTVMLPATTFTAMANTAGVWCGRNDDERASWQHLNTSRRGGKRSRSSAQHSDAMEDTHSLTWLGDADMGLHNTSSPSPAALVARLFHSDRLSYVSVLPFARLLPTYSAGAAVCRARTLPLMTRITLYGCDTHTLPRLRVRRDGGVRLAQQHNTLSIIDGHTKVKQVTASQDSTRMPAMSHTHYTALLAIDLGESQYIAKSRHAFTAIAESHVAYTTAASTRSSATAMERNDHQGVVQEQNSVAGLLMCLIRSPGQVIDTVSIAATLESLFWDMWHHRHGTGDKVHNTAISAAPAPAVTYVEIVYGDAEGAQKAMTTGMQTLLSTYAEQATAVLAGDQ